MTTLANALSKTIATTLLKSLPAAFAEQFELEETDVKGFLSDFLAEQLPKNTSKAKRAPTKKGSNGKGAITGYLLFSNEHRQSVKDAAENEEFFKQIKTGRKDANGKMIYEDFLNDDGERVPCSIPFPEVGRRLGEMWRQLTAAEHAEWNSRATDVNIANGLPPAGKAAPKTAKKAAVNDDDEVPPAPEDDEDDAAPAFVVPKVTRDAESKLWKVAGTDYIVKSAKNKVILGKVKNGKTVKLTAKDRTECEENGWEMAE